MTPKTKALHIRLDKQTLELLKQLAEQERETVSNYLRRLIWKQAKNREVQEVVAEELKRMAGIGTADSALASDFNKNMSGAKLRSLADQ